MEVKVVVLKYHFLGLYVSSPSLRYRVVIETHR
jgi:hypothetical protein